MNIYKNFWLAERSDHCSQREEGSKSVDHGRGFATRGRGGGGPEHFLYKISAPIPLRHNIFGSDFFALKIRCEETRPLICGIYLVDVVSRFFKLFLISLAFSFPSLISLFIASSSCNWGRFRRLRLLLMKLHLICFQTAVRLMIKR